MQIEYQKALDRYWEPEELRDRYAQALQHAEWDYKIAQANFEWALASKETYQHDLRIQELAVAQARTVLAESQDDDRTTLELQLQLAEENLALAQLDLEQVSEEIGLYQKQAVERAKLAVERLEAQVAERQVLAPYDGVILPRIGRAIREGDEVRAFQLAFVIGDPAELLIGVLRSQERINEVKEDTEVYMSLSSDATDRYRVHLMSGFYPLRSDASGDETFSQDRIYFSMLSPPERGKIPVGSTVYLLVVLGRNDDALLLPPVAIRSFRGRDFVIVQEEEKRRRVDVQVGLKSELKDKHLERVEVIGTLAGMLSVLTIIVCVPVFSYAVSGELLRQQLLEQAAVVGRSPFGMRFYYVDLDSPLFSVDVSKAMAEYISGRVTDLMGQPPDQMVIEIRSPLLNMMPVSVAPYDKPGEPLTRLSFVSLDDMPAHARVVEGEWPVPDILASGPIKVAVHEALADKMGLGAGERYHLQDRVAIEIAGIWREKDPRDPFWFNTPEFAFMDAVWVPEGIYRQRLDTALEDSVGFVYWYVIMGEQNLRYQHAQRYARALMRLNAEFHDALRMDYSPLEALVAYKDRAKSLTTLLYAVGAPMAVLALFFVGLTSNITVQEHRQEIAAMRSRELGFDKYCSAPVSRHRVVCCQCDGQDPLVSQVHFSPAGSPVV